MQATKEMDLILQYLILCPLEIELRLFLKELTSLGYKVEKKEGFKRPIYCIPSKKMAVAQGGRGKVQFGVQAQYWISHFKDLKAVFCLGAGGGLVPSLQIGDLVIAEKTIEYDYKEKFNAKAKAPSFSGDFQLISHLKNKRFDLPFGIHFGAIASGDEDIVDSRRSEELYLLTEAMAVAWEGAGGARACAFNGISYLEIRAITDNAKDSVVKSFAENMSLGMKNAANFISEAF